MGRRGKGLDIENIFLKIASRRDLPLSLRDKYGLNALDRTRLRLVGSSIIITNKALRIAKSLANDMRINKLKRLRNKLLILIACVLKVDDDLPLNRRHEIRLGMERQKRKTIAHFERIVDAFSEVFRFQNGNQLRQLINGFQIPERIRIKSYRFAGEEVLLISLIRLAWPFRWGDVKLHFPDRSRNELSVAFSWFINFMIVNWGYLILNNRQYWLPHLKTSAEHIRMKLATLPNEANRQFYDSAGENTGFSVALFIDNTILAMCRPGGGPTTGGEQAPRLPKEIQQAFWTGWKKLHGLKYQTLIMANGMDFSVWGPESVRRNDNFTLHKSEILEQLEELQIDQQLKFKVFGDSAYQIDEYIVSGGGKGMAAVRETIEWKYKDIKTVWKYCDYKHCLKLRKQPLGKIFLVCMLLRNAHVTMNGNQAQEYFVCEPPTFEDWISQGPRAHPLPEELFNNFND